MKNTIEGRMKFEILEEIADGGMGKVFKALKKGVEGFEKIVAIKTLHERYSHNPKFVDRFIGEAKLVANLVHENIVQIHQLSNTQREYYFVLEYVDGISLYDFMEFHCKTGHRMPYNLCVFIAARIARGLSYAHSRYSASGRPLNIVHCDVCPHNILLNTEGVPKLTDFGIARAANLMADDNMSGKLHFMSPEQANRQPLDFRSDIYSLGMVLFYLLAGGQSFRRSDASLDELLDEVRRNEIDWGQLGDDVDPEILNILHSMLATDPKDRFQDTATLARELEYNIYKHGYGPTIVTMAEYMKKEMPALFERDKKGLQSEKRDRTLAMI